MKLGDLIRNMRHPQAGFGLVVEVGAHGDYVIAFFPDCGLQVAYADEIEVISEGR